MSARAALTHGLSLSCREAAHSRADQQLGQRSEREAGGRGAAGRRSRQNIVVLLAACDLIMFLRP